MLNKKRQKITDGRCETKTDNGEHRSCTFDYLFDKEWEVFVIKYDKATGKFTGRTACCALAKVD